MQFVGPSQKMVERMVDNGMFLDTRDEGRIAFNFRMYTRSPENIRISPSNLQATYTTRTIDGYGSRMKGTYQPPRKHESWTSTDAAVTLFENGGLSFGNISPYSKRSIIPPQHFEDKKTYFSLLVRANDRLKDEGHSIVKRTQLVNDTVQSLFSKKYPRSFEEKAGPFKDFLTELDKGGYESLDEIFQSEKMKQYHSKEMLRHHFSVLIGIGTSGKEFQDTIVGTLSKYDFKGNLSDPAHIQSTMTDYVRRSESPHLRSFSNNVIFSNTAILESHVESKCSKA